MLILREMNTLKASKLTLKLLCHLTQYKPRHGKQKDTDMVISRI